MLRLQIYLKRLNRIARTDAIGGYDLMWLERKRDENNLSADASTTQLISQLQDIYATELIATRLTA